MDSHLNLKQTQGKLAVAPSSSDRPHRRRARVREYERMTSRTIPVMILERTG